MKKIPKYSRKFTIIELLVEIVIIAIPALILWPVLSNSRSVATNSFCRNNLKQISLRIVPLINDWNGTLPLIGYRVVAGIAF